MNVTPAQVERIVVAARRHTPGTRLVGIRSDGDWLGGASVSVDGERWSVARCRSRLELGERLSDAADDPLVVLTPLSAGDLGSDALSRLAGHRLAIIDRWDMVHAHFGARQVDPRLPLADWMADLLLVAGERTKPVANGWLDADTAWRAALQNAMRLDSGRPDAAELVRWSLDPERVARHDALDEEVRQSIREHLCETLGAPLGTPLTGAMAVGESANLMPIGLACEVLFALPAGGDAGALSSRRRTHLKDAVTRLESRLEGHRLGENEGRVWFDVARGELGRLPEDQRRRWSARGEVLLAELKVADFSALSGVFAAGFDGRLVAFGRALDAVLEGKGSPDTVEQAFDAVSRHADSAGQQPRLERLQMAMRLLRWLERDDTVNERLADSVRWHDAHGAFVDRARAYLLGGDPVAALASAFERLHRQVRTRREPSNHRFAQQLAAWTRTPQAGQGILPIERFLDDVVCALPRSQRVLVVVVDGMDGGVFEQLADDMSGRDWIRHGQASGIGRHGMLAMLPSVTTYSRAALLCGRPGKGTARTEAEGFAAHDGLRRRSSSTPVLFHKGGLTSDSTGALAEPVRRAIGSARQGVVGVVINAVDDHLNKSEQLRTTWIVDTFRVLDALLHEARQAGRAVVLTADHGHVLEANLEKLADGEQERWRTGDAPLVDGEIEITGPRLEAGAGLERAVLLWSEGRRYSQRRNGYHGGATPQEAVVPLGVFTSGESVLDGWEPLAPRTPDWWFAPETAVETPSPDAGRETASASPVARSPEPRGRKAPPPPPVQVGLFDSDEPETSDAAVEPLEMPDWIGALLASEGYAAQRVMAARVAPENKLVADALAALDERGGRLPVRLLAQALDKPEFRMHGLLSGLRRLLNVEGFAVLTVEESTDTVIFDRALLTKQFALGG